MASGCFWFDQDAPIADTRDLCFPFLVTQVMPFLSPFIGPGRLFNWLIRNQWRNDEAITKLDQLPLLLISSLEVISRPHFDGFRFFAEPCTPYAGLSCQRAGCCSPITAATCLCSVLGMDWCPLAST